MIAGSEQTRFVSNQGHLTVVANSLRAREWGKYENLHSYLLCHEEAHQFEYNIPGTRFIYDLALFEPRTLIEFDEPHHAYRKNNDTEKDKAAVENGWALLRIDVTGFELPFAADILKRVYYR